MSEKYRNYSHLIEMDEESGKLTIFRIETDGERVYVLDVDFPKISYDEDKTVFEKFASSLGECLLFDSPVGRRMFKLYD